MKTADPGQRVIQVLPGALEIRSRPARNIRSTGYVVRFKQFDAIEVTYDERTIQYTYDALSRLTEADHGEPRDANGLQYHRARYYAPGLAVWTALDPWEGLHAAPLRWRGV